MPRTDAVLFDLDGTPEQDGGTLLPRTFERLGVEQYTDQAGLRAAIDDAPDANGDAAFLANTFGFAAQRAGAGSVPAADIARTDVELLEPTAVDREDTAAVDLEQTGDGEPTHTLDSLEQFPAVL